MSFTTTTNHTIYIPSTTQLPIAHKSPRKRIAPPKHHLRDSLPSRSFLAISITPSDPRRAPTQYLQQGHRTPPQSHRYPASSKLPDAVSCERVWNLCAGSG